MEAVVLNREGFGTVDFHIHDSVITNVEIDYEKKRVVLPLEMEWGKWKHCTVAFCDVYRFHMSMCDTWGPSPHIFDWELLPRGEGELFRLCEDEAAHGDSRFSAADDALELMIQLTSGDSIAVLCREIRIIRMDECN